MDETVRRIKLIWDFRGQDAQKTAEHHQIHLGEYANREDLSLRVTGVESVTEFHWVAFITVEEPEMIAVRDALVPHRGELA